MLMDRIKLLESRLDDLDKKISSRVDSIFDKLDTVSGNVDKQSISFWKYLATVAVGLILSFVLQYVMFMLKG